MRLLNTSSLMLKDFVDAPPAYAILSHTWAEDEVLFNDLQDLERCKRKKRFAKVDGCCQRARSDGLQWVWIDTCCINKESSAELSEAINSMFRWYADAFVCYAFLADVPTGDLLEFEGSRWFRRGWTLQELLAPRIVEFYSQDWIEFGTKSSLQRSITSITGIPGEALDNSRPLSSFACAQKVQWASERETTRIEDEAYCLLGIFDINMPLMYGEGHKAFFRFQGEILATSDDLSLLAHRSLAKRRSKTAPELYASSPFEFRVSDESYERGEPCDSCHQPCCIPDWDICFASLTVGLRPLHMRTLRVVRRRSLEFEAMILRTESGCFVFLGRVLMYSNKPLCRHFAACPGIPDCYMPSEPIDGFGDVRFLPDKNMQGFGPSWIKLIQPDFQEPEDPWRLLPDHIMIESLPGCVRRHPEAEECLRQQRLPIPTSSSRNPYGEVLVAFSHSHEPDNPTQKPELYIAFARSYAPSRQPYRCCGIQAIDDLSGANLGSKSYLAQLDHVAKSCTDRSALNTLNGQVLRLSLRRVLCTVALEYGHMDNTTDMLTITCETHSGGAAVHASTLTGPGIHESSTSMDAEDDEDISWECTHTEAKPDGNAYATPMNICSDNSPEQFPTSGERAPLQTVPQ